MTFRKQLESPVLKDFRLIAFDFPGHGDSFRSSKPEQDYSPASFIKIIMDICNFLDAANGIIAGHSLGGHMVIRALEYLPGLKGALIFGTPPLTVPPAMDKAFILSPGLGLVFKPDLSDEEKKLLASGFVKSATIPPAEITESINKSDPLVRLFIGKALNTGQGVDEVQKILSFKKPFAIVLGEGDQLVNHNYFNDLPVLTDKIWEKKVHLIKDSGHSPQIEKPDLFNNLLLRFINYCLKQDL